MGSRVKIRQGLASGVALLLCLSFDAFGMLAAAQRLRWRENPSGIGVTNVSANESNRVLAQTPPPKRIMYLKARKVPKTDFEHESSDFIANVLNRRPATLYNPVAGSGAARANIAWENNQADRWYIEEQRYGEERIIGGLINNHPEAIASGFQMFDWGFARQAADGSFEGTGDPFHSISMFVQAVAHALLIIKQSPHSREYADRLAYYTPLVHRAARWMIQPQVWERGTNNNLPYTHRRYLVATALGLTAKLTGDPELMDYARQSLEDGLALQRPEGVNPEKDGHDSSYQMTGIIFAARWVVYFPKDRLTPRVIDMIDKAVVWEATMILPDGKISSQDNTRTGGQEIVRTGQVKAINHREVIRGFAYWASVTGDQSWLELARKVGLFYYQQDPAIVEAIQSAAPIAK